MKNTLLLIAVACFAGLTNFTGRAESSPITELPWKDGFDNNHSAWKAVDLDGIAGEGTWRFSTIDGNPCAMYRWSDTYAGNDYLVTVAPFTLKKNGNYHIAAATMSSGKVETIEAWYGKNSDPNTMTFIGRYDISTYGKMIERGFNFTIADDGDYYIAIKAASAPALEFLYVDYVIVDSGNFIPVADLVAVSAEWRNIYPSCELSDKAGAAVKLENHGSGDAINYSLSYKADNGTWQTGAIQTDTIKIGMSKIINIDNIALPAGNSHTLTIAVNSAAPTTPVTPENDTLRINISTVDALELPLMCNYGSVQGIDNWHGQNKWTYQQGYSECVYKTTEPGTGLISNCVRLEAGKTYNFDFAYWGQSYPELEDANPPFQLYTSFDIRVGKANSNIDGFNIIESFERVATQKTAYDSVNDEINYENYDTACVKFSVVESGDYVLAIYPTEFPYSYEALEAHQVEVYLSIRYANITEASTGIALPVSATDALRVYPVPATEVINVSAAVKGLLSIVDISGKTVMQTVVGGGSVLLNVSNLPSGVYMLRNGGQSAKFVKK